MEYCLIYVSSSRGIFLKDELLPLFEQSKQLNGAYNITGAIIYLNGNIMQVLEGSKESLETRFAAIEANTKHSQVIQLYMDAIPQRSFPGWVVAYKTQGANELTGLQQLLAAYQQGLADGSLQENIVLEFVETFYEANINN